MGNGKSIGNDWERAMSRQLSLWVSNGTDDDCFWRDLGSGMRATVRKKQGKETVLKGDLVCLKPEYQPLLDKFFIDTKSYKEFNPLIINQDNIKSNQLFLQWAKVCSDCPEDMIPLMPVRVRDRKTPDIIFMGATLLEKVSFQNIMTYSVFFERDQVTYNFSIMILSEFLKLNSWKYLAGIDKCNDIEYTNSNQLAGVPK